MNFTELVSFIKLHPWAIRSGASSVKAFRGVSQDVIAAARREAKRQLAAEGMPYTRVEHVYRYQEPRKKVLLFDLETAPMEAYVWGRWDQNIHLEQTISESFIICWSAKWLFSDTIMTGCLTPEEILNKDDSRIVRPLWELLDEADIVIAYNGNNFDIPTLNGRFAIHGFLPPSPYFSVDPIITAKKVFRFSSNKLDALATYFHIPCKLDTSFDLWKNCMLGHQDALDYMAEYNKKDVDILEQVYLRIRPYIKNHPNISNLIDKDCCCKCGSEDLVFIPDKYYYTQVSKFPLYRCKHCGSIVRGRKSLTKDVPKLNIAR